jgi:hypothetical protein
VIALYHSDVAFENCDNASSFGLANCARPTQLFQLLFSSIITVLNAKWLQEQRMKHSVEAQLTTKSGQAALVSFSLLDMNHMTDGACTLLLNKKSGKVVEEVALPFLL